jgi:hypothetical protein
MSTLNDTMLKMTSEMSTLSAQQAKTVRNMEKQHIKTAKLTSRMDQMDDIYAKPVKSRSIVDLQKSRKRIRYNDSESDDSNN